MLRVLLVDRNPGAYNRVARWLRQLSEQDFQLTWCAEPDLALEAMLSGLHDVILFDYQPDAPAASHALLEQAIAQGCKAPVIVLTEQLDGHLDRVAIRSGAADYLVREGLDAAALGRAIRYAIERKQAELRLAQLAHYDPLAKVPNRILFRDRLQGAIERARRDEGQFALMFIDLDGFKQVNDVYGHDAGDALICAVAERLGACIRRSDSIARIGGDEFTLILEDIGQTADIVHVARKVIESITRPVRVHGTPLNVGCSIGIAVYPQAGNNADQLLKHADMAMYQAKSLTGSTYRFYTDKMNVEAMNQMYLEADLRRGLRRNEFQLLYQPRVQLATRQTVGVEALIRWNHPVRGLVSPGEFIPLAEDAGLIAPLGYWAIHQACSDIAHMDAEGAPPIHVSVNLSFRQFQDEMFVQTVRNIIARAGIDPERLEFELTETAVMANFEDTRRSMEALRALGPTFSLDDFGTGYSSFTHLQRLPIAAVKIDRSFIQHVLEREEDATIVKAIITLAHNLNLTVVAEGAEVMQQVDFLREHACDQVQGFVFSHPLSRAALVQYLQRSARALA